MSERKKRKYTMSDKARQQRQDAAWKHGGYARSVIAQNLPPCRSGTCPLGEDAFPCTVRERMDDLDISLEGCPVTLVENPKVRAAIAQAIRDGDPFNEGVVEIVAQNLASLHGLTRRGFDNIEKLGVLVKDHMLDKEGNSLGYKVKANPAIEPTLKALDLLGHTGRDQAVTPKSQGERKRDEGVGTLVDFMVEKTRALSAGSGEEPK